MRQAVRLCCSPVGTMRYEHRLIVMDKPGGDGATKHHLIQCYIQTLAKFVGSEEDPKKRIYIVSYLRYFGFCCEIVRTEESSNKLQARRTRRRGSTTCPASDTLGSGPRL